MKTAFVILAVVLMYVYAGYPLLMLTLSLLRRPKKSRHNEFCPKMAVLVPVRNEALSINAKIKNIFASDYPAENIAVLVGADACTDSTVQELNTVVDSRLKVVAFEERIGKSEVLNRLAVMTQAEILVVSDSDVALNADALRLLTAHFADPEVGAVCGRRSQHNAQLTGLRVPARLYNIYESTIKRGEGVLSRVLGADGSLYALRRSLFRTIPACVPDDFVAVLRVLEAGARVVYENNAVSIEKLAADSAYQFVRKRRTVARGVRGLWEVRSLLNPVRFPLVSFLLWSHKLLRWSTPLIMIALLGISAALARHPFFLGILFLQMLFYCTAGAGAVLPMLRKHSLVQAIRYFVTVNAATAAGLYDVARGRIWTTWESQNETGAL